MSFVAAFNLVKVLEGAGKAGEKFGMTQETWDRLGFFTNVEDATEGQVATAYRMLWDSLKLHDPAKGVSESAFALCPEPADSVGFQFFINVPFTIYVKAFQGVVGAKMDGILGPNTWRMLESWNGQGFDLAENLLAAQEGHYWGLPHDDPDRPGLLKRVERVREWLAKQ